MGILLWCIFLLTYFSTCQSVLNNGSCEVTVKYYPSRAEVPVANERFSVGSGTNSITYGQYVNEVIGNATERQKFEFINEGGAHKMFIKINGNNGAKNSFEGLITIEPGYNEADEIIQKKSISFALGYGFIAVTVTNMCATFGVLYVPMQKCWWYPIVLAFMTALGIGSLVSSGIIVLIPEALRMNVLTSGKTYMLELASVAFGILVFLLLEFVLTNISHHTRGRDNVTEVSANEGHQHDEHIHLSDHSQTNEQQATGDAIAAITPEALGSPVKEMPQKKRKGNFCMSALRRLTPIAWMILLGDAVHNFMDGVAIGAGFMKDFRTGLTLSMSIMFEELPHELGDFAVLIFTGLSIKEVLIMNSLSACSAYLGMFLGIWIGDSSSGSNYVFGITAGLFLYISLADMMPELRQTINKCAKFSQRLRMFLIQCMGYLIGFGLIVAVTFVAEAIQPE